MIEDDKKTTSEEGKSGKMGKGSEIKRTWLFQRNKVPY